MPPIRTIVEMEVFIELRSDQRFLYQEIAEKVMQLTRLGMSHRAIAFQMGIDRNTVWKAQRWKAGHCGFHPDPQISTEMRSPRLQLLANGWRTVDSNPIIF
ncbi:MAG: hypothetical protein HY537_07115 [Deltaproteobacteria bacterium]|nr:hypothetical protein [Deltaproteobacteria bacterium]